MDKQMILHTHTHTEGLCSGVRTFFF